MEIKITKLRKNLKILMNWNLKKRKRKLKKMNKTMILKPPRPTTSAESATKAVWKKSLHASELVIKNAKQNRKTNKRLVLIYALTNAWPVLASNLIISKV